jgi:hypothetical protein
MSSHVTDPGQLIDVNFANAFADVPEVPAIKNQLNRLARMGFPSRSAGGEALEIVQLLDATKRVNSWWKTNHPNSLAHALQLSRGRRRLITRPRVDGSPLLFGQRGYSSSQEVDFYTITGSYNPYTVTLELCYADLKAPSDSTYSLTFTPVSYGSLGTVTISGNSVSFPFTFTGGVTSVLVNITGSEARSYASDLSGAPAKINQSIVIRRP